MAPVDLIESWAQKALRHPPGSRWPGPWKVRHPAYRSLLAAATEPGVRRLIGRASTQSGKTDTLAVIAAYFAVVEASPVLIYTARLGLKRALADRLRAFYREAANESLREAWAGVRPPYKRSIAGGGSIEILSSNEDTAFQMREARVVLLDEVRSHEQSLVVAAESRQAAWAEKNPLTVMLSSAAPFPPCRITEHLERSDFRVYHVPAPCCGAMVPCDWELVDGFGSKPGDAFVRCPHCEAKVTGKAFKRMVRDGKFVATKTADDHGSVGFHINELSNPNVPLAETARKYQSAMVAYKNTGQSREIVDFSADALAVVYSNPAASVDPETARVNCRLPGYDPAVALPPWVSMLTMAADVQIDRLETEIVGWGALEVGEDEASRFRIDARAGMQSWKVGERYFRLLRCGIHYAVLAGDPNGDDVWHALNSLRLRLRPIGSPDGVMIRPGLTLVDAGGAHTERVRAWSRATDQTCAPVKGASRDGQPLARPAVTKDILAEYGKPLIFAGTDSAKDMILASVRRSAVVGDHAWCWPDGDGSKSGYDWRYWPSLLASERRMQVESKRTGGVRSRYVRNTAVPNEALDLAVYNLSALALLGLGRLIENAVRIRAVAIKEAA